MRDFSCYIGPNPALEAIFVKFLIFRSLVLGAEMENLKKWQINFLNIPCWWVFWPQNIRGVSRRQVLWFWKSGKSGFFSSKPYQTQAYEPLEMSWKWGEFDQIRAQIPPPMWDLAIHHDNNLSEHDQTNLESPGNKLYEPRGPQGVSRQTLRIHPLEPAKCGILVPGCLTDCSYRTNNEEQWQIMEFQVYFQAISLSFSSYTFIFGI